MFYYGFVQSFLYFHMNKQHYLKFRNSSHKLHSCKSEATLNVSYFYARVYVFVPDNILKVDQSFLHYPSVAYIESIN